VYKRQLQRSRERLTTTSCPPKFSEANKKAVGWRVARF